jgi:hypothetical protein
MSKRNFLGRKGKTAPAPEATESMHMETSIATEAPAGVVEDVVETLEAHEAVHEGATETPTSEPTTEELVIEPTTEEPTPQATASEFDTKLASFSDEDVIAMTVLTAKEFDVRATFETAKDAGNSNIHRTIKKARAQMVTKRAARVLLATNVDPVIFNRSIHDGARYNVYAIGKLGDCVAGLTDGKVSNSINLAIMRSLFHFRAAKSQFTGEMAKAAASDKIRVADSALKALLVRHTVSASTAPTQASSTMQALETLGIVKRSGSGRNPNFDVMDAPVAAKLESVLLAA